MCILPGKAVPEMTAYCVGWDVKPNTLTDTLCALSRRITSKLHVTGVSDDGAICNNYAINHLIRAKAHI